MTSRDERRRARDPVWWQMVRARLARIKVAMAIQRVNALMETSPNLIEREMLDQRRRKEDQ